MAPIRRYLRITKYSVLEVRIYLDNPSLATSWLFHPRHAVLPRVMAAVRPLVLPKLKEENARERSKSKGKKRGVKDVIVQDDFEVSIFLTDRSTRHTILTKHKHFQEKAERGIKSNSNKLTGDGIGSSSNEVITLDDDPPPILREESDEDTPALSDIPLAAQSPPDSPRPRRKRRHVSPSPSPSPSNPSTAPSDNLFIASSPSPESPSSPPPKRPKTIPAPAPAPAPENEDKKKMIMQTFYDGFTIYGRVLCLVIRRREGVGDKGGRGGGKVMMEEWIASTQVPGFEDDDGGGGGG